MHRQLPVHSPLPLAAVAASVGRGDPRAALTASLASEFGATAVHLTDSGTSALRLALEAAARRRPALPCALPAFACYDIVSAAVGAGVPVRFYDLDPATLAPEPASLAAATGGGACAVVVVHLFGVPVPLDPVREVARRAGALLIEDAAQAVGGRWEGRPLGAFGDLAVLSFGRGKGETGGGGGALLVHDAEAAEHLRLPPPPAASGAGAAFVMKLAAQWALGRPSTYAIPAALPFLRLGETVYRPPVPPGGGSAATARVLTVTRPYSAAATEARRRVAGRWQAALDAVPGAAVRVDARGAAGWLRYPVLLAPGRDIGAEPARHGVARSYPIPLPHLPAVAPLLRGSTPTPGAERLAARLVTLPTHELVTPRDVAFLERWLVDAVTPSP